MLLSKILHLIVNYNNTEQTLDLQRNLDSISGVEHVQRVVINNSAQNTNDATFDQCRPSVDIINCPDNPGYFGAAMRASHVYKLSDFDFVILSNSDLLVTDNEFYNKLLNYHFDESIAAIGPSIRSVLTQRESNPLYRNRPSRLKIRFLKYVYSNFIAAWFYHIISWMKNRYISSTTDAGKKSDEQQIIYALNGSFIILRKVFFQKGGSFSYPVKLYGEEIYLAEYLRKNKMKTIFLPTLSVEHLEKGSEKTSLSRHAISYQTYLYKKQAAKYLVDIFKS